MDLLIRALIETGRPANEEEISQIIERIATAPFDPRAVVVPTSLRGLAYQGSPLRARENSLVYHLAKRVMDERQWAIGTVATEYTDDLRRAVRSSTARLAVYKRRGGHIVATLTPTVDIVPPERQGAESLPYLLVAYSADRGIILTGHQVTSLATTGIPEEARWLG